MRVRQVLYFLIVCTLSIFAHGQLPAAPEPERASVSGIAADSDGAAIPGATIVADGASPNDHISAHADDLGSFKLDGLKPGMLYQVTISEKGFLPQVFSNILLGPGQNYELAEIKLAPGTVITTDAESPAEIAVEEVHLEESQRILGVIPNFYTVFDHNAVPLTAKLKFTLAFRTTFDVVSLGAAMFLAGIDQAGDEINYVQGMKGYGQRVGAEYATAGTDIILGGAVFPSLFHQDPRYFYQGSGNKKSRAWHALQSPFICKGDNGKQQFNYSSIMGDLTSGALTNVYYPPSNRGPGLVFSSAAITTGGRMLNALAQEFLFSKLTTNANNRKQKKAAAAAAADAKQKPAAQS